MIRTGLGYDVHTFAEGRPLVLGGITIPHSRGLTGHSDADVLSHAISDALLGALGLPDIGYYFPPTDQTIKNIDSQLILIKCRELADERNAIIHNIDSTIVAEEPKILPHRAAMIEKLASSLRLDASQINIKATTHECMGAFGRGEGMAAMAVATIDLPNS